MAVTAHEATPRRWYGHQLIVSDALSISAWIFGALIPNEPSAFALSIAGTAGYLAAPPTIHGLHKNVTMAIVSPLMRLLIPAMIGGAIGSSCADGDWSCGLESVAVGGAMGMVVAATIDYAAAWEDVAAPAGTSQAARAQTQGTSLGLARVAPIPHGAALVLGGRF